MADPVDLTAAAADRVLACSLVFSWKVCTGGPPVLLEVVPPPPRTPPAAERAEAYFGQEVADTPGAVRPVRGRGA